jgi:hypothetical protein
MAGECVIGALLVTGLTWIIARFGARLQSLSPSRYAVLLSQLSVPIISGVQWGVLSLSCQGIIKRAAFDPKGSTEGGFARSIFHCRPDRLHRFVTSLRKFEQLTITEKYPYNCKIHQL